MMQWLFGLLALCVATTFLASLSAALVRRLPSLPDPARPVVFLLVFTALQSLLVLAAGLAGLLAPEPMALVGAAGLFFLVLCGEGPVIPRWRRTGEGGRWRIVYLTLTSVGVAVLVVKSFLLSPYWPDALYYHLSKIAEWIRAEGFVHGFHYDPRIWWTAGFEVVETWWVVFLGRDALIEFGGLQMLALSLASVRLLAVSLGYNVDRAVAVFAFVPVMVLQTTACGNDLAAGAMVLSGFALVASRSPRALQLFPLVLGAGIKATVIFAIPAVVLYMFFVKRPSRMSRSAAVALLAIAAIVGGVWYGRNYVLKGHPMYPVYGEDAPVTGYRMNLSSQLYDLRVQIEDLPKRAVDPAPFSAFTKGTTSFGWFIIPVGLPLMIAAIRRDRAYRHLALAFAVGWAPTIAFSPQHDFNLRFALWFAALPALAAGGTDFRAVRWAILLSSFLNFSPTVVPYSLSTYDSFRMPESAARGENVAWMMAGQKPTYLAYGNDFSRSAVFPISIKDLKASGARYVWVPRWMPWLDQIPWLRRVSGRLYELSQVP